MPATSRIRGSGLRLRPFYTTVFLLTLLATWSFFTKATERHFAPQHVDASSPLLRRNELTECRDVHRAEDQCAFVKAHCAEDEAGLLSYLTLYYCNLGKAQPVAFAILVCWLGLLFTTIGIAASDFFSVNLNTISTILGLSESLAGVTFLAFGNGSPDVFSTFAAMGSNSASMAVGELIGAASFITAVVAGSMALVREFKVGRQTYVRDLCFFIVAVCFTMVFLADGHLHLWECITMVCYYIFYVVFVVTWHYYSKRRSQRRVREAAARGHVYGAVGHPYDELAPEPYRDDPDDEDRQVTSASASNAGDISALEAGPRIEVEGQDEGDDEVEESDHGRHVVAEMASNMRVLRPRGRRRNTLTPIRPSLVGALEFRSALAQLQRESNLRMRPMHGRAYSVNNIRSNSESGTVMGPPSDSGRYTISGGEGLGQRWQQKSHWDRFVSAISVPSILLLVLTLPVVESESPDDLSDDTMVDPMIGLDTTGDGSVTLPEGEPIEQESEWQRFRRATLTHFRMPSLERTYSPKGSPALIAIDDPSGARVAEAPTSHPQHVKPAAPLPSESSIAVDDSVVILWANMFEDFQHPYRVLVRFILYTLLASTILLGLLLITTSPDKKPKFHFLLCFMGFIIAIAWISTIAGEVVGVLKAVGVILGISEALLGLTIFAAGNSVGDLIADITVARLGYPVMALSACFGGPMLNILLGIGIGGVYMMVQAAKHRHKKHPDKPFKYHSYEIQIGGTLMISAITLLLTLLGLLLIVPMNKWIMSRKIGWGLIAIWTVSTIVNVVIEVTGVWTDVSYSLSF
ncbi:putative cation exchanger [Colletotrichum sp. SAR11_59]|nr:putative cation exchanger [Colletotrichum sp. SAR11_59]